MLNITDMNDILILSDTLYVKNNSQARILLALMKARNTKEQSQSEYDLHQGS